MSLSESQEDMSRLLPDNCSHQWDGGSVGLMNLFEIAATYGHMRYAQEAQKKQQSREA